MGGAGRLYLHVGLAKTGTTFLQTLLAENRPRLREAGFVYPFVRPEGMFHAAVEVRRDHARWGLDPAAIAGTWAALLERARQFDGAAVISHEILAGATAAQVEEAARRLEGFELHLVVTARDIARQVPAHWQEAVKNGETFSFAEFTREVLREPGAPQSELWNEQDLLGVVARWAPLVEPERVNIVVCPRAGADRLELWRRFASAVGIPGEAVDTTVAGRGNESLGASAVHLLRAVNACLDGRIRQPTYAHVVKRTYAQRILSELDTEPARTPASLREPLETAASEWIDALAASDYVVHGDLAELWPTEFSSVHPDSYDRSDLPDLPVATAVLLEEVAAIRAGAAATGAFRRRRPFWRHSGSQAPAREQEAAVRARLAHLASLWSAPQTRSASET
jgi:hypothetical protein